MELNAMTMMDLISKRVIESTRGVSRQLDSRLSPRASAGIETTTALEEREAEGAASAGLAHAREHDGSRLAPLERLLLERLRKAPLGEWNNLPTPMHRPHYEPDAPGDGL